MPLNTATPRNSSRTSKPFNPGRRHRANFARAAVFAEFGRAAFAIDQGDFSDREPWQMLARAPEAGLAE